MGIDSAQPSQLARVFNEKGVAHPRRKRRGALIDVDVHHEIYAIWGYLWFWTLVVVGVVCTRMRTVFGFEELDYEDTLLIDFFGYNNICFYFDSPPATYILPPLYIAAMYNFLLYLFFEWLKYRVTYTSGNMSHTEYKVLSMMSTFQAFTFILFTNIFAVSPEDDNTLRVHTIPFIFLELGLVSMTFSNWYHGFVSKSYQKEFGEKHWIVRYRLAHAIFFALVVVAKVPLQIMALVQKRGREMSQMEIRLSRFVDVLFLFCAAVVPVMYGCWYLKHRKKEWLLSVRIKHGEQPAVPDRSLCTLLSHAAISRKTMTGKELQDVGAMFSLLDDNNDGEIMLSSLRRIVASQTIEMASEFDTDTNGMLTTDEWWSHCNYIFKADGPEGLQRLFKEVQQGVRARAKEVTNISGSAAAV